MDCMDDNSCCFANGTFLLSFMNNFFLNLKSGMFKNACGSGTPLSNSMFEIISNTSIAPITIKFQLSKDALAGEHPLYLSYIYMNNNETYMSQYIVNIHIRAWYEKAVYQILLAVIAIITVITSILGISRESILIQRIRKKYIKAKHYKK